MYISEKTIRSIQNKSHKQIKTIQREYATIRSIQNKSHKQNKNNPKRIRKAIQTQKPHTSIAAHVGLPAIVPPTQIVVQSRATIREARRAPL
jgi:hypothetical protein